MLGARSGKFYFNLVAHHLSSRSASGGPVNDERRRSTCRQRHRHFPMSMHERVVTSPPDFAFRQSTDRLHLSEHRPNAAQCDCQFPHAHLIQLSLFAIQRDLGFSRRGFWTRRELPWPFEERGLSELVEAILSEPLALGVIRSPSRYPLGVGSVTFQFAVVVFCRHLFCFLFSLDRDPVGSHKNRG
jgi:hypothetical protein